MCLCVCTCVYVFACLLRVSRHDSLNSVAGVCVCVFVCVGVCVCVCVARWGKGSKGGRSSACCWRLLSQLS